MYRKGKVKINDCVKKFALLNVQKYILTTFVVDYILFPDMLFELEYNLSAELLMLENN